MGLIAIPRALLAEPMHEIHRELELMTWRGKDFWQIERGEMIGLERTVQFRPRQLEYLFGWGPEPLKHDDLLLVVGVQRQLDIRQDPGSVRMGNEQGSTSTPDPLFEHVPVDQTNPGLDGIDSEPGPRNIKERQGRNEIDDNPLIGQQVGDGALKNQG